MKRRDLPVTVVVPVKNEEANISRCLSRLTRFQEVVVIDSSSTDKTAQIATTHGARVVNFEWNGAFPKKRNWFHIHHGVATEWVLFLDADELIDDAFCEALATTVIDKTVSGYWLNYTNHFLGVPLKHGLPQRKLALFRPGKGQYEKIDEERWSGLDMEVHEHPIIDGNVGEIRTPIEHNDDRGIRRFIERHVDYAFWEAARVTSLQATVGSSKLSAMTRRQRVKYRNIRAWWYPSAYFVYTYVVRRGFLDGWPGFAYAAMKYWYFTTIQIRLAETRRQIGK